MLESSSYQVAERRVDTLFSPDSVAFQIPIFQRRYAWGTEEVSALLADLYDGDEWLNINVENFPYFLGSIVVAKGDGPDTVLDGQQRLTTISLLLAVLKYKLAQIGYPDAQKINVYLEAGKLGQRKTPKIKLQPEDASDYSDLIDDPTKSYSQEYKKSVLAHAVRKISENIDTYVEEATKHGVSKIDALERMTQRVLYGVEFVQITSPSEAAAFRLFETLNDRGLPLNAADLVKNKLFSQCGEIYINEARESWKDATEAVGAPEIVNFLRYYMIAFHKAVRKDKLYDIIRDKLNTLKPAEALAFAKDIQSAAELYKHIANPSGKSHIWNSETVEGLKRLNILRARSCRPALLACARLNPSALSFLVRACEVITIRYSTVGELNPNQLEKAYDRVCQRLRADSTNAETFLHEIFSSIVPSDDEFRGKFENIELSNLTSSWREILVRLNYALSTGETQVEGPSKVHIEHILPRNPSQEALDEAKLSQKDVDDFSGKIGNLTLLHGKKNQQVSNKPFSFKRPVFEASEIALNRTIAERSMWGKEEIESRSKELAQLAVQVWPWPVSAEVLL